MIITCNRIIFPVTIDDDDEVIREAKMKHASKNIRKRRITFHMEDVAMYSEYEDTRFVLLWFYYSEPIVIEHRFDEIDRMFKEYHESTESGDDSFRFWIPAN